MCPHTDPLAGVRIKIERAKEHVQDLEAEITAFLGREPYRIVRHDDANTGEQTYRVSVSEDVPLRWGAIIGDVIHNLRTALDHLACQLALANGGGNIDKTYFPISETRHGFETKGLKKVNGASEKAVLLIKRLKPYKGGNDALWRLHQLDIADKHRLVVVVGAAYEKFLIRFPFPGETEGPAFFVRHARRIFPLKDNTVLVSTQSGPITGNPELAIHPHYEFPIAVAFGQGQIFDGEPIIPTLQQLVNFVERVVAIFQRHCF